MQKKQGFYTNIAGHHEHVCMHGPSYTCVHTYKVSTLFKLFHTTVFPRNPAALKMSPHISNTS